MTFAPASNRLASPQPSCASRKRKNRRLPREIQGTPNVIVFRTADLDRPSSPTTLNSSRSLVRKSSVSWLAERSAALTVAARAKWILLRLLGGHRPELGEVAKDLGMSIRILQRRITNEGTSFRGLVSDARQALPAGSVACAGRDRLPARVRRSEFLLPCLASGEPLRPICVDLTDRITCPL